MKKLFIGSLAWATDDESLRKFFEQFGTVTKAEVVRERDSNRSRGFGFVEFENDDEADAAVSGGDGKELDGRAITVSEARAKTDNGGGDNGSFRKRSW
jgi:RNA recognition motif-containing protein